MMKACRRSHRLLGAKTIHSLVGNDSSTVRPSPSQGLVQDKGVVSTARLLGSVGAVAGGEVLAVGSRSVMACSIQLEVCLPLDYSLVRQGSFPAPRFQY